MPFLGTFEAGSDWELTLSVVDQADANIDLTGGSGSGYVSRGDATYLSADTLTGLGDGTATWAISAAESGAFPAGIFDAVGAFTVSSKVRIVRATFEVVRAPHV